ncbi:MAG: UbiD family decarboxylase [bacterium]
MFNDLREYIERVKEIGEYRLVEGAAADQEIGAINYLVSKKPDSPLLLFDKIKGYQPGFRVASNLFRTMKRTALGLGFPLDSGGVDMVKAFRDKINDGITPLPPVEVADGPVLENVFRDHEVDLLKFPAPKWHELDGGPYIGTGTMTVVKDPETGWVNVACYRVQVHDKNTCTVSVAPAHQLAIIQQKYWNQGQSCPVAICCGQEPMTWLASIWPAPWGVCEYDIAGWWRGEPVAVVPGVTTGLPVPATAEIVLEGEILPPGIDSRPEGPFGEWAGYYASEQKLKPACRIKSVMHRENPIIQGNPPSSFPAMWTLGRHIQRAATVWSELDRQIPGVQGVWMVEDVNTDNMMVISLKQAYSGHAKQAAVIAAGTQMAARHLHYLIVVDEDIDPSDMSQVLWAVGTRADPATAIDIIHGQVSSSSDTTIPPYKKDQFDFTTSLAVILACRPYHWRDRFPKPISVNAEIAETVKMKWKELFTD